MTDEQPELEAEVPAVDPTARRRRVFLVIFALVALVIVAPAIWMAPYIHHRLTAKTPLPVAAYQGFSLRQDPVFRDLIVPFEDEQPPSPLYVQLPDGQKFLLVELPEAVAAELLPMIPERDPPTGSNEYSDARSFLTYRDGKLAFAVLHGQSEKFRVSSREAGPYAALPLDRDQLIAALGEPLRWERPSQGPPEQE